MTTEVLTAAEEAVIRIKERPHWRLLMEPAGFQARFASSAAARDAVCRSTVAIRGWDFPHEEGESAHGHSSPIAGGWESWNSLTNLESWRVGASSQFVYYATLDEDASPGLANKFVLTLAAYRMLELVRFSGRLSREAGHSGGVRLVASAHGISGRELYWSTRKKRVHEPWDYRARSSVAVARHAGTGDEFRGDAVGVAAALLSRLAQHFGFEPAHGVFVDLVEKLTPGPRSGSELSA